MSRRPDAGTATAQQNLTEATMEQQNPYRSPESTLVEADSGREAELAGRGVRLGAAIIDTILLMLLLMPAMYVGGYFEAAMSAGMKGEQVPFTLVMLWAVIGFVAFIVLQAYPLNQNGQTWGKKLLGIKIVDLDGNKPPLGKLLALRYLPVQMVVNVPMIGPLAGLVNVLFIFRDDRRCVHDLIAGTRVVQAG